MGRNIGRFIHNVGKNWKTLLSDGSYLLFKESSKRKEKHGQFGDTKRGYNIRLEIIIVQTLLKVDQGNRRL